MARSSAGTTGRMTTTTASSTPTAIEVMTIQPILLLAAGAGSWAGESSLRCMVVVAS